MSIATSRRTRFLRLDRVFDEHREQYLEALSRALDTGQVVGGPEVERLESRIADHIDRRHAIAVGSGTDAMILLLTALGIGPDWTVLVPAYSFVATASPLLHRGVVPTFVDVDQYYHLDLLAAEEVLPAKGRRAMIVVGLFGNGLDHAAVESFCADRDILLIEDAAQSFGSHFLGRADGGLGLASTLSFAPTKPLACFGNMGAVVTDDDSLAARIRSLRYHGIGGPSRMPALPGFNSVPSAGSAAMLNVSLDHFERHQRRRASIADEYCSRLEDIDELGLPAIRDGASGNWHKFVVRHPDRDALKKHLEEHGVETQIHYPYVLPDLPIFADSPPNRVSMARRLASDSLTLPLHPVMTPKEVDDVVESIRAFGAR